MTDEDMAVTLTVAQLRTIVRDAARDAVAEYVKPAHQWADVPGCAKHFGCSKQTVRNWIERGCPARQLGERGEYRLRLEEIEAWLDTHKRGKLVAVK